VLVVLWYLVTGTLRTLDERVGDRVLTDAGQAFTVYRETTVRPPSETTHRTGAVLTFEFHLWFMPDPLVPYAVRVFEPFSILTTPFFAGLPGFRTKLWLFDHDTGDYQGIYQWETVRDAERYARALTRVMAFLSVPGSVSYEVADEATLDEYVASHAPGARAERATATQWLRRGAAIAVLGGLLVAVARFVRRGAASTSDAASPDRESYRARDEQPAPAHPDSR